MAGPAVNVVIAAILIPIGVAATLATGEYAGISRFILELGSLNLWLAIFNMVPLFPMDGGRVLRAVLQFWLGRLTATEIAARIGLGLGLALMATGVIVVTVFHNIQGMMLVLLSGFVIYVGRRESLDVRRRQHEMETMALQVLPADADVIDVNALPARPNFSGFTWDSRLGMWVEWREGRPVHTIQVQPE